MTRYTSHSSTTVFEPTAKARSDVRRWAIAFTRSLAFVSLALLGLIALPSCAQQTPAPIYSSCPMPAEKQLGPAMDSAKFHLTNGCEMDFERYLSSLLAIAEGDPGPENKRHFSDFLVWSNEAGILSRRQAEDIYNRYFNVKFVSLRGDYNNCAYTCPIKQKIMHSMEEELLDKELGLLRASADQSSYYRADRLYKETELVLEATCAACPTRAQ